MYAEIAQVILLCVIITILLIRPKQKRQLHRPYVPEEKTRTVSIASGDYVIRDKLKPRAISEERLAELEDGR